MVGSYLSCWEVGVEQPSARGGICSRELRTHGVKKRVKCKAEHLHEYTCMTLHTLRKAECPLEVSFSVPLQYVCMTPARAALPSGWWTNLYTRQGCTVCSTGIYSTYQIHSIYKMISIVRDKIRDAFITCKCIKYNEMVRYKTVQQYMANSIPPQGPDAQIPNVQQ
jgi:hypothetical protein